MNLHPKPPLYNPPATNLVGCLNYWAKHRAEQIGYYFVDEQDEVTQVTYSQLDRRARAIAAQLISKGCQGERALLFFPPGLEFVAAFFGCLYAGTTAVPAFPPRRNRNMARVDAISEDAQAAIVLTVQDVIDRSASLLADEAAHLKDIPWLATDHVSLDLADSWREFEPAYDSLAVLQYTSGSTGAPKGVMLTHANLMHNCSLITYGFEADQSSVGVSWLPTYHDMGLVGGILNPLFIGRPNAFMAPMSFLQKPIRWLRNIDRFNVTISGGPNFAYALCNDKISEADCEGLDLSSWKVAFNGAEPVRADTLARFAEKFGPYGFREEAFYPCYGMAESTLIVSGSEATQLPHKRAFDSNALESNRVVPVSAADDQARQLISSGRILPDQQVLIVDPETCRASNDAEVGEIWVRSGSIAQGYWNKDAETDQAFHGQLTDSDLEGVRFLRTGDLGFFHEDQLFVTGRSKDLIIINGRNLYPHDIESIVEHAHPAIRIGGGAAFSIESESSEQLVIVQELARDYRKYDTNEITAAIRQGVFKSLDVAPHAILLLKMGKLPKTSSGKVQRRACREQFLSGRLDVLVHWCPGDSTVGGSSIDETVPINSDSGDTEEVGSQASIQAWLVDRIAKQLKSSPAKIDVNKTFAYFGLDSVTLIGISGELEDWLGCSVSPKLLFNYPTIFELSEFLANSNQEDSVGSPSNRFEEDNALIADSNIDEVVEDERSASQILATLDEMTPAETTKMLRKFLEEKARQEVVTHSLSYGQRALWFLYEMDRSSSAYNIMYASRVRRDLDRDAFCRAFQSILDRHEILRTTYATVEGSPVQRIHPQQTFEMQTIDARDWSQDKLDAEIQVLSDIPFDLEEGPVLRVHLLERAVDHHVLLFVVHHIALDFWSFDLLFDELELFYREAATGAQANLPAVQATHQDFVRWQQQELDGTEGDRLWEYWQQQLDGELPLLDLPTDHPRPRLQSFRGNSYSFDLPDSLTQQLKEFSKSQGVTLFATCLAAFQVMLYRYTGQQDIVVGCPTAGRTRAKFKDTFGYFVNSVALRSKPAADLLFADFLQQVRETLVGGISHQDFPFPLLVERLQVPRDASRSPVFQVGIGWDTPRKLNLNQTQGPASNGKALDSGSLGLEPFGLGQQGAAFDLMLTFLNSGDSVSAALQFNLDLFEQSSIERMVEHLLSLLTAIVDNPTTRLSDLPLLSPAEEQLLLRDWNDTSADIPEDTCLHELFESQVKLTPDAIAVEFDGKQLTYEQLNSRANQFAHHLNDLGVGPDVLVAVYVERSLEMLIGMLAVLKASGAFVPLSPDTPTDRLTDMLQQCQSPVVLTQHKLAGELPANWGHVVCLDRELPTNDSSATNLRGGAKPANLAYAIFTSGSTGKPKGVQIEHRAVVNFLASMQREPGVRPDDIMLAVTTISFDISLLELFLPLTVGAKVVIVCPGIAADGIQLAKMIADTHTTIMQATPSTWRLLVEGGWSGDNDLKLLCGGEAMPPDLADALLSRCGELWNMYGPTETTIWSAIDRVEHRCDPMPIGNPIANTQLYILDQCLQPVPRGVTGNLYIGGDGLSRGYLGQPELTAEKFVENPFHSDGTSRLYKTGDLARYRSDGRIEFLGREDFQVKVRGFRIELDEIETRLVEHPAIRQAVVNACQTGSKIDDKQLVGYFTAVDQAPNTSDLRDFLRRTLPDYMVPSIFISLDSLPLNSAGKIDRGALPKPGSDRPELRNSYVAPRNETEENLARIWARVLRLEKVGVNDNFFDLGGASMQSLEIAALAGELRLEIFPASLFQYPTIAELVTHGLAPTTGSTVDKPSAESNGHIELATNDLSLAKAQPSKNGKTKSTHANIIIESIGVYLPPNTVSTEDVVAGCKNKVAFPLEDMTGIKSRRVSADDEFTSDIAAQAVAECLENSRFGPDDIDLIVCCHIGRDEQPNSAAMEPGTAMYLKRRLGFPNAVAFDISNACAGMFTGVSVAESYLNSGAARRAIVVSAEHISPVMTTAQQEISGFIDPRIACLTLGDAGAAVLLENATGNDVGFQELELYSLSKYSSMCIGRPTEMPHGGPILVVPDPIKHTSIAIENSVVHSKHIMDRSTWEPDHIDWVIMHQTSERSLLDGARAINETFQREICTKDNTINNLSQRGNTASTSHFVAVWDNIMCGRINAGDNVVFGITGSGQTIGTALYKFDDLPRRIRDRKRLGYSVESNGHADAAQIMNATGCPRRIRAESVGVFHGENGIEFETIPMVKRAVKDCLRNSRYERTEIDLLLFAGVYRTEFILEPALATMIAGELKINDAISPFENQNTFAFDVVNGAMSFLTATDVAAQMIRSGKIRTALIIASEIENNREEYPDDVIGVKEIASAVLVDDAGESRVGLGEFVFKYLPEQLDARTVTGEYTNGSPRLVLQQDPKIEELYLSIIPAAVTELLNREGLSVADIKLVLPPQFSREFLDELSHSIDISRDKFVDLTDDGSDLFTSSLPCSLLEIKTKGLARSGDIGLVINVGAGLQVGCATYYF